MVFHRKVYRNVSQCSWLSQLSCRGINLDCWASSHSANIAELCGLTCATSMLFNQHLTCHLSPVVPVEESVMNLLCAEKVSDFFFFLLLLVKNESETRSDTGVFSFCESRRRASVKFVCLPRWALCRCSGTLWLHRWALNSWTTPRRTWAETGRHS